MSMPGYGFDECQFDIHQTMSGDQNKTKMDFDKLNDKSCEK